MSSRHRLPCCTFSKLLTKLFVLYCFVGGAAKAELTVPPPLSDRTKPAMRELTTDRPDKTESPYTVDAGHFQFETDLLSVAQDKTSDGSETRRVSVNNINLKVGLSDSLDFQAIFAMLVIERTRKANLETSRTGFGDTFLRLKWNLVGNDEGQIAMGLMPVLRLPTAQHRLGTPGIDGGLIFLLNTTLSQRTSIGTMLQCDYLRDSVGSGHHFAAISTLTGNYNFSESVGGYVELFNQNSAERDASWSATLDAGITYEFIPLWQLDLGVNVGLTDAADDLNPFIGLSAKL